MLQCLTFCRECRVLLTLQVEQGKEILRIDSMYVCRSCAFRSGDVSLLQYLAILRELYSTNKILAFGDITLCLYNHRPPTKLREGNVFSRICLSGRVDIGTALHPPPPDMGLPGPGSPASDIR